MGDKCERYSKGNESHYIYGPRLAWSTYATPWPVGNEIHALCGTAALIAQLTSGGTQKETLNGSCPDCYCERNSLASRDYLHSI